MAYDEKLAKRVREILAPQVATEERAMFGGIAFMVRGHMCCGLVKDKLMIRVDADAHDALLAEPGAEPMDFTGRPMQGFLYVSGPGIATRTALRKWLARSLDFVQTRPEKSRDLRSRISKTPARAAAAAAATRRASGKSVPPKRAR